MSLQLALVTAPTEEPVEIGDAKKHLRVDGSEDDDLITNLIIAARELAENFTRRAFVNQTWDLFLDCFPAGSEIRIPRPPLQSVSFLKYTDLAGVQQTIAGTDYIVDKAMEPGRLALAYLKFWPTYRQVASSIQLEFVAGYGATADKVPQSVKQAMLLMIGDWYKNREPTSMPPASQALLWSLRSTL